MKVILFFKKIGDVKYEQKNDKLIYDQSADTNNNMPDTRPRQILCNFCQFIDLYDFLQQKLRPRHETQFFVAYNISAVRFWVKIKQKKKYKVVKNDSYLSESDRSQQMNNMT